MPDTSDLQSDVLSLYSVPNHLIGHVFPTIHSMFEHYLDTWVYPPITRCVAFDKTKPKIALTWLRYRVHGFSWKLVVETTYEFYWSIQMCIATWRNKIGSSVYTSRKKEKEKCPTSKSKKWKSGVSVGSSQGHRVVWHRKFFLTQWSDPWIVDKLISTSRSKRRLGIAIELIIIGVRNWMLLKMSTDILQVSSPRDIMLASNLMISLSSLLLAISNWYRVVWLIQRAENKRVSHSSEGQNSDQFRALIGPMGCLLRHT